MGKQARAFYDKIGRKFEKSVDSGFEICYNHLRQRHKFIGELCNGSTYDSDSYCLGSNPSSPAIRLHGQAVKTLPSQGKIMGSIPIGGATKQNDCVLFFYLLKNRFSAFAAFALFERDAPCFFTFFEHLAYYCNFCNLCISLLCAVFYYMAYIIRRL